jgi:hypothetical protein
LNISFYTVTLPRFHNGTRVLVNIYAEDASNNVFNLGSSQPYLEYIVFGNWLETFNVSISALVPGTPFEMQALASLRSSAYRLQVIAYFYNPDLADLAGDLFQIWSSEIANATQTGALTYYLSWPFPEDLVHGMVLYISLQMVDEMMSPVLFLWNGSYSMANGTSSVVELGASLTSVAVTTNVTLGRIVDNVAPALVELPFIRITPTASQGVNIYINLTDVGSGIKRVVVYYRVDGEAAWHLITTIYYNGLYVAVIPKQGAGAHVEFYIEASDIIGNTLTTSSYSYDIPAASYNLYIFLFVTLGIVLLSMYVIRRVKKGRRLVGPSRYKWVKKNL